MLGFYRCTDTCLKMLTIDEQIFIYSIITFFQLYIKMFKRQNISISLFLSGRLPAFWVGYSFFIKWPHIFKNTPWGRAVPSLIEKTTIPCVLWRKKKSKKDVTGEKQQVAEQCIQYDCDYVNINQPHSGVCACECSELGGMWREVYKFCSISSDTIWFKKKKICTRAFILLG